MNSGVPQRSVLRTPTTPNKANYTKSGYTSTSSSNVRGLKFYRYGRYIKMIKINLMPGGKFSGSGVQYTDK